MCCYNLLVRAAPVITTLLLVPVAGLCNTLALLLFSYMAFSSGYDMSSGCPLALNETFCNQTVRLKLYLEQEFSILYGSGMIALSVEIGLLGLICLFYSLFYWIHRRSTTQSELDDLASLSVPTTEPLPKGESVVPESSINNKWTSTIPVNDLRFDSDSGSMSD